MLDTEARLLMLWSLFFQFLLLPQSLTYNIVQPILQPPRKLGQVTSPLLAQVLGGEKVMNKQGK